MGVRQPMALIGDAKQATGEGKGETGIIDRINGPAATVS